MRARIFGLAAVLLVGAAQGALAQDREWTPGPRGPIYRRAEPAQTPPQAPQPAPAQAPPPAAQAPQADRGDARGADRWSGEHREGGGHRGGERVWEGDRRVREEPTPAPSGGPRFGDRDGSRGDGERRNWRRDGGDRRGWDRQGWDRGDQDRHDTSRDNGARSGWDRDHDRDRDRRDDPRRWSRDNQGRWDDLRRQDWARQRGRDVGRWELHRYPPVYSSHSRFRGPQWRPPRDYFVRSWRFGEVLPYGWYTPDYRILDWWAYDLPEPPPGYDWVRVGEDALLVDDFDGRIAQVVRLVFW